MYLFKYLFILVLCAKLNNVLCASNSIWDKMISAFPVFKHKSLLADKEYIEPIYKSSNITEECAKSISDIIDALNNFEDWSYQMYDSWAQFPPKGILEGSVIDFGDYDQCLSIKPNQVIGESQYCLIDIKIPLPEPPPLHINLNHKVDVLPKFFNKSGNNFFIKLSENAIYFYLYTMKIGICTPKKCNSNDILVLSKKSKKSSKIFILII